MTSARAVGLPGGALASLTVGFCRLLRERGLGVTPSVALDAARSLELIDVSDLASFAAALRANLTISVDENDEFDRAFRDYWGELLRDRGTFGPTTEDLQPVVEGPPRQPEVVYTPVPLDLEAEDGDEARLPGGHQSANELDLVTNKDFATFTAADLAVARRFIQQLRPSLATVSSRRRRPASTGGEVDLRRTVRAARSTSGDALRLARHRKQQRKLRMVVLCDVSGSMDAYSEQLLQFLFALQGSTAGVSTFVFSTRLHDVTSVLRRKRFGEALRGLGDTVATWSGGTTISACLREFNTVYGRRLLGPRTVVLIVSDGWERGDVAALAAEMAAIRRNARHIIWLNPLAGREGYAPLAAGMAAALPYIDDFLPAHSIASLARLSRTLATIR